MYVSLDREYLIERFDCRFETILLHEPANTNGAIESAGDTLPSAVAERPLSTDFGVLSRGVRAGMFMRKMTQVNPGTDEKNAETEVQKVERFVVLEAQRLL